MTYSSGSLIQSADYNGFVGPTASGGTAGANINDIWGVGSGDKGFGQTAVSNSSVAGTITATQWASLVNTLSALGGKTVTTITARTAPTAGSTIGILSALNTDLTNVTTNRANAHQYCDICRFKCCSLFFQWRWTYFSAEWQI